MSDIAVDNPSAKFDALFKQRGALPCSVTDEITAIGKIEKLGKRAILERIASGQLLNEIAIDLGVPIMVFRKWIRDNVSEEDLLVAREACAESLMLKSTLVLTVTYDSPGHASIARAFSERLAQMAERLDPERWAQRKPKDETASPVTIVFEGMGGDGGQAPKRVAATCSDGWSDTIDPRQELEYVLLESSDEGDAECVRAERSSG